MLLLFLIRELNDHLFEKELFIRFNQRVFRESLSNFVCVFIPLLVLRVGCGMWDVVVLIPDHRISIYF